MPPGRPLAENFLYRKWVLQHQIPTGPVRVGDALVSPVTAARDLGVYIDTGVTIRTQVINTVRALGYRPGVVYLHPPPQLSDPMFFWTIGVPWCGNQLVTVNKLGLSLPILYLYWMLPSKMSFFNPNRVIFDTCVRLVFVLANINSQ